eukprot:TRINITY_DN906_c0_g1_i28.p1 TRINITY_DN906_c0_g1~~TRINITY_DN906_c0_g1_i28.p1  ORF type:complete len:143 (+),score=21.68 TRINITY_DN906_c0_g1_i28:449-877(+)
MKRIKKDRLKQNNNFDKAEKWEEWKELPDDEEGIDYPGAEIEEEEYVEEEEEEEEEEGSKPAPRREEAEGSQVFHGALCLNFLQPSKQLEVEMRRKQEIKRERIRLQVPRKPLEVTLQKPEEMRRRRSNDRGERGQANLHSF